MTVQMCVWVLVAVVAAASAQSAPTANDPVAVRVQELFAKADELAAQVPQRSREYLASLSDEQLAQVIAKVTAGQAGRSPDAEKALIKTLVEEIARDRQAVITKRLTRVTPLSKEDSKALQDQYERISTDLAALGPTAVSAIASKMGLEDQKTGHPALAKRALTKMGSAAVEPLIPFMKSSDDYLRENVAQLLSVLADARAKDVLLEALADRSGSVRRDALHALCRLGPSVVGAARLNAILIERLEDGACIDESTASLGSYGDQAALEPLRVVKRFYPDTMFKGNLRPQAARAINRILERMGKPAEEVGPDVDKEPDYDNLIAAASCPNAVIRSMAVSRLQNYRDERTLRFLNDRLREEKNPLVVEQLDRAIGRVKSVPQGISERY